MGLQLHRGVTDGVEALSTCTHSLTHTMYKIANLLAERTVWLGEDDDFAFVDVFLNDGPQVTRVSNGRHCCNNHHLSSVTTDTHPTLIFFRTAKSSKLRKFLQGNLTLLAPVRKFTKPHQHMQFKMFVFRWLDTPMRLARAGHSPYSRSVLIN